MCWVVRGGGFGPPSIRIGSLKLTSMEFSHTKFERIFGDAIISSTNNIVLEILGNPEKITARRLTFKSDR